VKPPLGEAGRPLRLVILALLALAPLAIGSVHPPAFIPLLSTELSVGLVSWALGHWRRALGQAVPAVPAGRLLLAFHALVLLQLVPLPPRLLRLVSPGSFAFRDDRSLVGLTSWQPISVSPPDTLRGFVFLAGASLLYAAVFREFEDARWRRRLAGVVVATGLVMTVEAFWQAATGDTLIYGLWRPRWDWAVFGPYVNRHHFAGYLAMAIPPALAFAVAAVERLARQVVGRPRGWLALGERVGARALALPVVAMTLVAGLFAAASRGGFLAFVVSGLALPLAFPRRRLLATLGVASLVAAGVAWVGIEGLLSGFEKRGVRASRLAIWRDALTMVPRFPLLGDGFNAFGTAFPGYQTAWREYYTGEAHNEYLQALVDTGMVGFALTAGVLVVVFRRAIAAAPRGALEAGLLGSLIAAACHNLVDFNWQIPANAATCAALAGVALRAALQAGNPPARASFGPIGCGAT